MLFTETKLKGAFLISIQRIEDHRGFFGRAFCRREFEEQGLNGNFVQINCSRSNKTGTMRGMHVQIPPHGEAKLIRCVKGRIYDVIIDLRPDSPTFKQWVGHELSETSYTMVYVPEYFAHGFLTLEDDCEVYYPVTEYYTPGAEHGIRWDDPAFSIRWPVPVEVYTQKDAGHPDFDKNIFFRKDGQ